VIAENLMLPMVDWTAEGRGDTSDYANRMFGIKIISKRNNRFHYDSIAKFSELVLASGAFSSATIPILADGVYDDTGNKIARFTEINGVKVNEFAVMQLSRILMQIECATEVGSVLVLSKQEQNVISELGKFLQRSRIPSPIDIPDLSTFAVSDGENFAGGLLNFSPPDALSIAAVRSDPKIQGYAARVREILSTENNVDTRRGLVAAMREALEKSEIARKVDKIFEVESLICKPLHYVPGLDTAITVIEDGLELGKRWLNRDRSHNEWFLLSAKMTDIALRDYLTRTNNL
jgi:hypothetical protein